MDPYVFTAGILVPTEEGGGHQMSLCYARGCEYYQSDCDFVVSLLVVLALLLR